jgi:restriction endonuclease S subunit
LHGYSQGIVDDRLRLYPKAFAQIPVNLPPLAIQREIAASFEALADFVAAAERQHVALASLRRAITDDLLSGRVRVPA